MPLPKLRRSTYLALATCTLFSVGSLGCNTAGRPLAGRNGPTLPGAVSAAPPATDPSPAGNYAQYTQPVQPASYQNQQRSGLFGYGRSAQGSGSC